MFSSHTALTLLSLNNNYPLIIIAISVKPTSHILEAMNFKLPYPNKKLPPESKPHKAKSHHHFDNKNIVPVLPSHLQKPDKDVQMEPKFNIIKSTQLRHTEYGNQNELNYQLKKKRIFSRNKQYHSKPGLVRSQRSGNAHV